MKRSLILLLIAAGCNNPVCGKGTKQVQNQQSGNIECVPVDQINPAACADDADAGTVIVGGKCVGTIQCDPATTMPVRQPDGSIACVGTGGGGRHCQTPAAGTICVEGTAFDFSTHMPVANLPIAMFDPIAFLTDPGAMPFANGTDMTNDQGQFVLQNVTPGMALIAIAAPNPRSPVAGWATGGSGAQVTVGQKYKIDAITIPTTVVEGWHTAAGFDYLANGAEVACFYNDPTRLPPPENDSSWYETMPAAGVQIADGSTAPVPVDPAAKYFGPTMITAIDPGTSTTALGCGIAPANSILTFTGKGGEPAGKTWEVHPGGSAPNVIFFDRFHPM
jgi:hypothetical protein